MTFTRRWKAPLPEEASSQEQFALVGLVANPDLPGVDGELVLNVYAWVTGDGTGFGVMTDPMHPEVACDLGVDGVERDGSRYQIRGHVIRSNSPRLAGQPFVLSATIGGTTAYPLDLLLMGDTYSGRGLVVIAIIAILIPLLLPAVTSAR